MKLVLAAIVLAGFVAPVYACKFEPKSDAENFASAATVFRATVTELKLSSFTPVGSTGKPREVIEVRYEVKEVFKGTPPANGFVRDSVATPGSCSLRATVGFDYIFFPAKDSMVTENTGSFGGFYNNAPPALRPRLKAIQQLGVGVSKSN
jgi:hypothetical protein